MTDDVLDLRAASLTVRVTRGDAWTVAATIWTDAAKTTAQNLTGCTVTAQLRNRADDTEATDLNVVVTDAAAGKFSLGQDAATISGVYDVQVLFGSGQRRTYLGGRLEVSKDVTRP